MDIFLVGLEKYKTLIELILTALTVVITVLVAVQTWIISNRQNKITLYDKKKETYKYLTTFFGLIERICITIEAADLRFHKSNFENVKDWMPSINKQYESIINIENSEIISDSKYLLNRKTNDSIQILQTKSNEIMQAILFLIFSFEGNIDIKDLKIEWDKVVKIVLENEEQIHNELRKVIEQSKKDLDLSKVDK